MFTSTNIKGSMRKQASKRTRGTPPKKTGLHAAESPAAEVKLPDTDGWLTRNEASDVLRCSLQTLKNYESRNILHPRHAVRRDRTQAERMMLVYSPKELAALPSRNGGGQPRLAIREPGEQAARAFEMFRQGQPLDEVVIELRETPDRIDHLHDRWLEQTHTRHVITPEAKRALEQLVGAAFKDVTELVEMLAKKLGS
jgi:hypothetical protein